MSQVAEASVTSGPVNRSLRQRAVSASWWSMAPTPLQMGLRFLQSIIVARFLAPEHFGLMALVGILLNGVAMFSDLGLRPAAIRSENGADPEFLRTTWTLQILRGAALWIISMALAAPFAWFYKEPIFMFLVPVAGSSMLISSFGTTAGITFSRHMELRKPTMLGLWMMPAHFAVTVGLAIWLQDVWALVWSSVLTSVLSVLAGHAFLPGIRHRFAWHREYVRELISFGKWVFVSTIFTFVAMQSDKLILGKLADMDVVGVYGIALVLAHAPLMLIGRLTGSVLFPVFSEQFRENPQQMATQALRARRLLMMIGLILCLGVLIVARHFFRLLYLPEFWDAGWIAEFAIASVWAKFIYSTTTQAALAIGDSRILAVGNGVNAVVTVIGCVGGFWLGGVPGFILGYALGTVAGEFGC